MFFSPCSESQATRHGRGAVVGLAAHAAMGVLGGDVALGISDTCGLRGIFGGCLDDAQANAANVRRLSDYQDILTQFVTEFSTNTDGNFFLVQKELAALNAIQAEMASNQNRNWAFMQRQFNMLEQVFRILGDCNQVLLSNQHLNLTFDALSSLLAIMHAGTNSYRSALFAFRMNSLNSLPVLLRGQLAMSLLPMVSVLVIL